jgi:hypothetical protein
VDPNWLVAIGGLVSAVVGSWALVLSVSTYLRSRKPPVEWRRFNDREDGHYRIVNVTSGTTASEVATQEVDGGSAFTNHLTGTDTVMPGGWIPVSVGRAMADPFPTVVEISWREGPFHGKPRKRIYKTTLNF